MPSELLAALIERFRWSEPISALSRFHPDLRARVAAKLAAAQAWYDDLKAAARRLDDAGAAARLTLRPPARMIDPATLSPGVRQRPASLRRRRAAVRAAARRVDRPRGDRTSGPGAARRSDADQSARLCRRRRFAPAGRRALGDRALGDVHDRSARNGRDPRAVGAGAVRPEPVDPARLLGHRRRSARGAPSPDDRPARMADQPRRPRRSAMLPSLATPRRRPICSPGIWRAPAMTARHACLAECRQRVRGLGLSADHRGQGSGEPSNLGATSATATAADASAGRTRRTTTSTTFSRFSSRTRARPGSLCRGGCALTRIMCAARRPTTQRRNEAILYSASGGGKVRLRTQLAALLAVALVVVGWQAARLLQPAADRRSATTADRGVAGRRSARRPLLGARRVRPNPGRLRRQRRWRARPIPQCAGRPPARRLPLRRRPCGSRPRADAQAARESDQGPAASSSIFLPAAHFLTIQAQLDSGADFACPPFRRARQPARSSPLDGRNAGDRDPGALDPLDR